MAGVRTIDLIAGHGTRTVGRPRAGDCRACRQRARGIPPIAGIAAITLFAGILATILR
jgi:hypothetical protein